MHMCLCESVGMCLFKFFILSVQKIFFLNVNQFALRVSVPSSPAHIHAHSYFPQPGMEELRSQNLDPGAGEQGAEKPSWGAGQETAGGITRS